jgi:hypothetical protein
MADIVCRKKLHFLHQLHQSASVREIFEYKTTPKLHQNYTKTTPKLHQKFHPDSFL